eukprot:CAMPEP_0179693696 /NCGR_PEP_ID=MMETSP0936-20121108/5393_1 /TAXON_ID=548131 ORGANISM="Ostreococcus mediterraneus, Strain clade-D-RCC2573" /NCGR_SAMPLE_ID=MMETSP0936 /ASSEMBLY_ACC=CAM_ASM_000574 /LENGTH=98 /DNA_ID=CAMNT_0021566439 /DNA_START=420 /DNA_END=713 /DNA_ORIENTATION=+
MGLIRSAQSRNANARLACSFSSTVNLRPGAVVRRTTRRLVTGGASSGLDGDAPSLARTHAPARRRTVDTRAFDVTRDVEHALDALETARMGVVTVRRD